MRSRFAASDLESIRALFNEKEKELSIAVAKVEELTRQLEELQRGRDANSAQMASSVAAVELEKLRAELLVRLFFFFTWRMSRNTVVRALAWKFCVGLEVGCSQIFKSVLGLTS